MVLSAKPQRSGPYDRQPVHEFSPSYAPRLALVDMENLGKLFCANLFHAWNTRARAAVVIVGACQGTHIATKEIFEYLSITLEVCGSSGVACKVHYEMRGQACSVIKNPWH